jgi:hypothetical protein
VSSPAKKIFFSPQMWAALQKKFQAAHICFASGGDDNSCKLKGLIREKRQ